MCFKKEIKQVSESIDNCTSTMNNFKDTVNGLSQKINGLGEDSKDKIYLQLHEQYAINNNANLSTIMTLVVALIVVIGYFGNVFIKTTNPFSNWSVFYDACTKTYYLDALILVYIASISILAILFCLCTYQGIAQRKEQFIIYDIRKQYQVDGTNNENNDGKKVHLPDLYHPYNKTGLSVIQGLYGELVKIFIIVFIVLTIALMPRVYDSIDTLWLPLFTIIVLSLLCFNYYTKQYTSYIERQIEYEKNKNSFLSENDYQGIESYTCSVCKMCEYEERVNNKNNNKNKDSDSKPQK